MSCKSCGKCCERIPINKGYFDENGNILDKYKDEKTDFWFDNIVKTGEEKIGFYDFYIFSCPFLKDNLCSIYEDRPYVCSGYPFYNRQFFDPNSLINQKNCGYIPNSNKLGR